mgnify:CR=1 FL=1
MKFIFTRLFFYVTLLSLILSLESQTIKSYKINDILYFSIEDICKIEDYTFIHYEDKSKISVLFDSVKVTFSENSSFIQIDNSTKKLLKGLLIQDNTFFIPANSFNMLSSKYKTPYLNYIKQDNQFLISSYYSPIESNENISESIQINKKDTIIYGEFANNLNFDKSIKRIILDAGHGGKDPGAIGYYNIKEKNIVLDITKKIGNYIKSKYPEIDVIYTRDDDTFLGLRNRTNIANEKKGQIFISIHANASTAKSARGFEIFLLGTSSVEKAMEVTIRENASIAFEENQEQYKTENQIIANHLQMKLLKESEKLAIFIENNVKKELPKTRIRGIKQAGFHVLVGASMPNLLVEVGFLTNKSEAKLLNKSGYRKQMAKGIFEGIDQYIKYYEKKYLD